MSDGLRLLVCGGRDYSDAEAVNHILDRVRAKRGVSLVIEGGARGADRLGRLWARSRGIEVKTVEAEWDRLGRAAGHIRNGRMITEGHPDAAVAFPGGPGTRDMIERLRAASIPVWVIEAPKSKAADHR